MSRYWVQSLASAAPAGAATESEVAETAATSPRAKVFLMRDSFVNVARKRTARAGPLDAAVRVVLDLPVVDDDLARVGVLVHPLVETEPPQRLEEERSEE